MYAWLVFSRSILTSVSQCLNCFVADFAFVVREAVQKAELDASLAAEDAVRHGHKAEERVKSNKGASEPSEGRNDHVTDSDKPTLHIRTHASIGTICYIVLINWINKSNT